MALSALLLSAALVAFASGPASAKPDFVNGRFDLQASTGPHCPPPLQICMSGSVNGKVNGTFTFQPATFEPTASLPSTLLTTGTATVQDGTDSLQCEHAGALQIGNDGPNAHGPFVSLCIITGGTGKWAGAQGYLRISGTFTLAGGGAGSYDGTLVVPR
jgi:hypothetical protein